MEIKELQGKLVAVLGFGQEGRAVANYLLKHGINPVLFDARPWQEWSKEDQEYIKSLNVNFIFGPGYLEELKGFDVAFRSPGIKISQLTTPTLRSEPRSKGVEVNNLQLTSQTKWFFEHCPAKIIGVTGTKGKGTTATLISEILKLQCQITNTKYQIYLTGNIGKDQPLDFLDDLRPEDWVVYELSSFQLQDLTQSPHISVVLMTTSEHLDYHKDANEYAEAKSAIAKYQKQNDFTVINADFESSIKIGKQGKGQKLFFSRQKEVAPGCFTKDGNVEVKGISNQDFKFPISQIQLKGDHNLENICAATTAAVCAGCDKDTVISAVRDFKGLEHRLEFVSEKDGIKFYNDSFSTTPETAIAAIKAFREPEILILGGSSKNSDFSELGRTIAETKNVKALILIGEEADKIKKEINSRVRGNDNFVVLEGAESMQEVFGQVKSVATKGDVVLLSPACASFDMFKNYKDRGEQFKEAVKNYSNQSKEILNP